MDGICQSCLQNEGKLYQCYYGRETIAEDKEAVYLPQNKDTAFKILGKSEAFLCNDCVGKHSKSDGIRIFLITFPILLFGIFGYLITEIDYRLKDFVNFLRIALGMLGLFGLKVGITRFIKPEKQEKMAIELVAKINKLKKNTGATAFFTPKEYASLKSRQVFQRVVPPIESTNKPTPSIPTTATNNEAAIVCPKCGYRNQSKAIRCQKCLWLIEVARTTPVEQSAQSASIPFTPQSGELLILPSQIVSINAAANLAILNAVITLIVGILQFIAGGEAIIAGVINAVTAIYYFTISTSIRKRDSGAYKAGLSAAKWGLLWVLGMFVLYVNTSGGIDCVAAFIFGGWLITDGLLYLNLQNAKSAFPT